MFGNFYLMFFVRTDIVFLIFIYRKRLQRNDQIKYKEKEKIMCGAMQMSKDGQN